MQWQNTILTILDNNNVSVLDLLNFILRTRLPAHAHHRDVLHRQMPHVLDLWSEQYPSETEEWALRAGVEAYRAELLRLIQQNAGFHFRNTQANLEQLETFSMVEMGKKIKELTPNLWMLLGQLLDVNPNRKRAAPSTAHTTVDEDAEMDLGEIGGKGHTASKGEEDWSMLESEREDSDISNSESEAEDLDSTDSSDDDVINEPDSRGQKPRHVHRRRKQNPSKRNAILMSIVSI